jgi:hypothetical protein
MIASSVISAARRADMDEGRADSNPWAGSVLREQPLSCISVVHHGGSGGGRWVGVQTTRCSAPTAGT